jgi:hypothetical protein
MKPTMYQLIIGDWHAGPFTGKECRREVDERVDTPLWHWCYCADGSLRAVADDDGRTLAEAVPA